MLPLIEKLCDTYHVSILTENNNNKEPNYEMGDDISVYRYHRQNRLIRFLHTLDAIDNKKDRGLTKNSLIAVMHPIASWLHRFDIFKHSEYKLLKDLIRKNDYICILSTCARFLSHLNVLQLKKEVGFSIPWIAYFMDPYAYFIGNLGGSDKLIEQEREVYEYSDIVLVTEEIFEENKTNLLSKYMNKTEATRFANFRCDKKGLTNNIFVKDKINCVYVGSLLNESIRSPSYLFKIINLMDDKYVFHIICNNLTRKNRQLRNTILDKNKKVRWYNNLPLHECLGIMSKADILINLGNKSINQTPSKIFDYIGTGRPIVNFYSLYNDTSKRYLERYPKKLNLLEMDNLLVENKEKFEKFAFNESGQFIQIEDVKQLYGEYLSEKVTADTLRIINKVIGGELI
jgi:hypothetical protein